jgi:hypothetical protein
MDWLQSGLIQQIPVAVILVYAMERFLRHLDNRDKTLGNVLSEFTVAVREMSTEIHALGQMVTRMESRAK